ASGQGKTTLTAALARHHRREGRRVRVFKTGPDFLDPMILERASGAPVYSLDLWMVGEHDCRALLADAAAHADLILIEGVMGLFDGTPSSADLAAAFDVPVAAVISAQSLAQTFGAIAFGLAHFRPGLPFYGVLANRIASPRHGEMVRSGLPDSLRLLGQISHDAGFSLPDRHLGLFQASEIGDLEARLERAADAIAATGLAALPPPVAFAEPAARTGFSRALEGRRIALARDDAFSFVYPANLDLLRALGAELSVFSPLRDEAVPAGCDTVYLPGGYPELHAPALANNQRSAASIRAHVDAGRRVVAECGGMLYLLESLTDSAGHTTPMLGLLPGRAEIRARLAALGMQQLSVASLSDEVLTGHTFHYSVLDTPLTPVAHASHPVTAAQGEPLFRHGSIVASYMHGYWPSAPSLIASLFRGTVA
ncbi:MAG TPA: cobyrinate a,c-diamide synthase, partial [Pararobbsia sp.]|nr:cobyrinate a,c-diamide synthase [Pararobbsia sp.]